MFRAIKYNDIAKLKKEVFLGADINAKDVDGDTPIIKAIKSDRHSSFEFLLHNGANLLIEDSNGHNALDLIVENRRYEYILSVVRAGYKIKADKDLLMHQISHRKPILRNSQDLPTETKAIMEMHHCKAASTLYHHFGAQALTYETGVIILTLLGTIMMSMHLEDEEILILVTAVSPEHPYPLSQQIHATGDWYTMLIEDNVLAIQSGIAIPYTRLDLIDLIENLHDEVIEKYIEATGR